MTLQTITTQSYRGNAYSDLPAITRVYDFAIEACVQNRPEDAFDALCDMGRRAMGLKNQTWQEFVHVMIELVSWEATP